MIQGKVKTIIPLLKNMIKTRINTINFKNTNFATYGVEDVLSYAEDMLNLINGIYQDYIVGAFTMETTLQVDLKKFIYKKIN